MPKTCTSYRLVVLFFAAAVVLSEGCGEKDVAQKPDVKAKDGVPSAPNPPAPTPPAKHEPDIIVTSNDLWQEVSKNKNTFPKKYEDKLVELSGLVMQFDTGASSTYIFLEGEKGTGDPGKQVKLMTRDLEPWKRVVPDQIVVLRATMPSDSKPGPLIWEIVDVKGPAPIASAQELVKEMAADRESFDKKYQRKYIVVTGEIAKVELDSLSAASVYLTPPDSKPAVVCSFPGDEPRKRKNNEGLKMGQKIKLLGMYSQPSFLFCEIIELTP